MMKKSKISIIVPLYKAAKHVPTLVTNVQKQTFADWELILVNDGSPDNTLQVCEEFTKQDARIHVIDQQNQGPSVARNTGIYAAKGEWITFVDADDALLDNFLLSMIIEAEKNPAIDIVYAGYIIVERSSNDIYTYDTTSYIGESAVRIALANTQILHRCCPWGKLFRKSVIDENNLRFDSQLRHSEDRLFVYDYLLHTHGIATTSTIGYLYDSTTITSLKNKHLDPEMLYHRQQKLQDAAHAVIEHFGMKGEECFMFAKHLFGLFSTSIQSLYEDTGNTKVTIANQQDYYSRFFDQELHDELQNSKKWQQYANSNQMLIWALNRNFKSINSRLATIDRKIAISNLIAKLTNRMPVQRTFLTAVHIMNR